MNHQVSFGCIQFMKKLKMIPKYVCMVYKIYMKISASMCDKISYNTRENEDTLEKHLERANMLIESKHWDSFSHQAIAMNEEEYENMFIQSIVKVNGKKEIKREMGVAYNIRGFKSFRYIIENEQ